MSLVETSAVPNLTFSFPFPLKQSSNLLPNSSSFTVLYFRYSDEGGIKFCYTLAKFSVKSETNSRPQGKCAPDHLIACPQYPSLIGSWIFIKIQNSVK